jgi:hypothetical protein
MAVVATGSAIRSLLGNERFATQAAAFRSKRQTEDSIDGSYASPIPGRRGAVQGPGSTVLIPAP